MKVERRSPSELDPAWRAAWLAWQAADATLTSPFFHPEYALAVGEQRPDLELLTFEDGAGPAGVLALHRDERGVARPVGLRLTDLQGAVVRPGLDWRPDDVLGAADLRAFRFSRVPLQQQAFAPSAVVHEETAFLDLGQGFDAYVAERRASGQAIRQMQRKARKAGREVAPLRFELRATDDAAFEQLLAWKAEQRARTKTRNMLAEDWVLALLQRLRSTRADGFEGLLSALYFGDELAAVHFGIAAPGALHYWFPAYADKFASYSPGAILLLELAAAAPAEGWGRIDLGPGEERYKKSFRSGTWMLGEGVVDSRALHRALHGALCRGRRWARHSPMAQKAPGAKRFVRRVLGGASPS